MRVNHCAAALRETTWLAQRTSPPGWQQLFFLIRSTGHFLFEVIRSVVFSYQNFSSFLFAMLLFCENGNWRESVAYCEVGGPICFAKGTSPPNSFRVEEVGQVKSGKA